MKLKIYEEPVVKPVVKPEDIEPELTLKLVKGCNEVNLCAVDKEGRVLPCGFILSINKDGKLIKCSNVDNKLGLSLDANGVIEEDLN